MQAENDALRESSHAAGRRRLHIKAVCQSVREATTASGVDNATSPDWQTPLNRMLPLRERLITMQKQLEGTWSILMSSAIELPISWSAHAIIVSNTHALPAEYKCLK